MLRLRVPLSATIAAKTACRAMASISGNKFLRQQAFVNGEWVQAADGRVMDVLNPATGEKIAQVPVMQRSDVARACEVSHAAWDEWKRTTAKVRGLRKNCAIVACKRLAAVAARDANLCWRVRYHGA